MANSESSITDKIDRKIISLLLEDARMNFSEIGEEVGLSKNAIWTRYENMCKQGVITGATVQVNYKKLGYEAVGQLLLLVDPSKVEQVADYIKIKIPDVFGPFISASRFNMRAIVTFKTLGELGNLKENLRRRLPTAEVQSMIWTDVWFTPQNLTQLSVRQDIHSKNNVANRKIIDTDTIDLELIKHLAVNSRISFRNIAKEMELSADTLGRRYKKLWKEGIIIPRIQFDPKKIGYPGILSYFLRINRDQDAEKIIAKILSTPDVMYMMKCTGDYQISVMIAIKDLEHLIETGAFITKIEGLTLLETSISPFMAKWPMSRAYTST
jgi:Lrp/AsnC family leucine-responsive transcriptional regulator